MAVPAEHAGRFVYHTTHLNNLEGILERGILSCNEQRRLNLEHHSIAAADIQERRARMQVTAGPGGVVHDYVPLYFTKLSPMLLQVVTAKNVDQMMLLHFAFPISLLERDDTVFTDAAANTLNPPRFYSRTSDLNQLNWQAIDLTTWRSKIGGEDVKQKRMAEALVHTRLDPGLAGFIVIWNKWAKSQVQQAYSNAGLTPPNLRFDEYDEHHVFTHFRKELPNDMLNTSIAAGPIWTRHCFEDVVKKDAAVSERPPARYPSLSALLLGLRAGLTALPETAELIGLESENEMHTEDVGTHTDRVVQALRASERFVTLSPADQDLLELAAYLHDIGKGPKSRWRACNGKQQVDADHPIRSAKLLQRILLEEVHLSAEETRLLCKLVCYHDLVGDITGRGRDPRQLAEIAETERDLDMLIALGEADMASVLPHWGTTAEQEIPSLRAWVVTQLEQARTPEDG